MLGMDNVTFNKATVELPEGQPLVGPQVGVRFLVRGTEAYILDRRGVRQWSAQVSASTKAGRDKATVMLETGEVLTVTNDCGCGANRR